MADRWRTSEMPCTCQIRIGVGSRAGATVTYCPLHKAAPALLAALKAADEWSLNLHDHNADDPCPSDCVAQQVVEAIRQTEEVAP